MEASEDQYEEEEQLVVVHLAGVIDPEYIRKCDQTNCRILGIDSDKPVLQLDQMCFQGTYEDSVGTNIILEEQEKACSEPQTICKDDQSDIPMLGTEQTADEEAITIGTT